jgi:hypothetical protein
VVPELLYSRVDITNIRLGWKGLLQTNTSLLQTLLNFDCKKVLQHCPQGPVKKKNVLRKTLPNIFVSWIFHSTESIASINIKF